MNEYGSPAGQVHHCQRLAAGVGRRGYHVRADGLPGAGSGPAALDPAGLVVKGPAYAGQAVQRRGQRGGGLDKPGGAAEPAEIDIHIGQRRLRGGAVRPRRPRPEPGQREMLR